jgi:hypothetical protein
MLSRLSSFINGARINIVRVDAPDSRASSVAEARLSYSSIKACKIDDQLFDLLSSRVLSFSPAWSRKLLMCAHRAFLPLVFQANLNKLNSHSLSTYDGSDLVS